MIDLAELATESRIAIDKGLRLGHYGLEARNELGRLRAALREIADLNDVRCDEAPTIARRALGFDDEQTPAAPTTGGGSMEQGGISDRLSNFDEWGDRNRERS